jgi:DNA-directed RNA polymerase specialized sigma24 family protein
MLAVKSESSRFYSGPERFATTHWSVVLQAGGEASSQAAQALEKLCLAYWYPLYAYVRRKGYSPSDAQDLTQEFFLRLLGGNFLQTVEQRKGRFRSFLVASLEHFLVKEWVWANRQKRGGGQSILSLDETSAEGRYALEPADKLSPQRLYERRWAMTLLDEAMKRLRDECLTQGKAGLFERVKNLLTFDRSEQSYREMAAGLGMNEGAFRVAVHRLRQRYGILLREEIAQTVASPREVDEEVRCLFAALSD